MFVEDLIQKLYYLNSQVYSFDMKIIHSLYSQYFSGVLYTEKQGNLALQLLKKYKSVLSTHLNQDISTFLDNPKFKKQFRSINTGKKIEIIDHPTFTRAIKVTFPYDEALITKFKTEKVQLHNVVWDNESRAWFFSLHERNILFLSSLIQEFNFVADQEFMQYISQIDVINAEVDNHIPMIVKHDNDYMLKNNHHSIDSYLGTDLISSLFNARKKGFFIWDDIIDDELDRCDQDEVVKKFLRWSGNNEFILNIPEHTIDSIETIIKNLFPCLIVVPGGSELEILKNNFNFLDKIKIDRSEITVLFRLSNETNKEFNDFIKQQQLNNPIDEHTKVLFVSNNIPKPLIESKINFNCILNYNLFSPHYKLRDFINHHHNVINIVENKHRRFNFDYV